MNRAIKVKITVTILLINALDRYNWNYHACQEVFRNIRLKSSTLSHRNAGWVMVYSLKVGVSTGLLRENRMSMVLNLKVTVGFRFKCH